MSVVQMLTVEPEDAGVRLDRWFGRRFPTIGHGRLEKLLRTGQVRVNGGRASAGQHLETGQNVRIPPLPEPEEGEGRESTQLHVGEREAADLRARVLYRDDFVIAINKPAGLAVQGGTGMARHLDGMLEALRFDARERPRLVHRLDKDTSGVLLLARTAAAATTLAAAFHDGIAQKVYWALVVGVPKKQQGRISAPLVKMPGRYGERMMANHDDGRSAVTDYRVLDVTGTRAAWLEMEPKTGRTHQLRAHCALIGTPIMGDGKYGGSGANLPGAEVARRLHLHARSISIPIGGKILRVVAPLPRHMADSFAFLGFNGNRK